MARGSVGWVHWIVYTVVACARTAIAGIMAGEGNSDRHGASFDKLSMRIFLNAMKIRPHPELPHPELVEGRRTHGIRAVPVPAIALDDRKDTNGCLI